MLTPKQKRTAQKLLTLFKINDKPAIDTMTEGQIEIFATIAFRLKPRGAVLAPTGYGKTEAVSMAAVVLAALMNQPVVIASVKYGTSDLIMKSAIGHIFDSPVFIQELQIDKEERLSRLKDEKKKTHLTFRDGGALKIVSLYGSEDDVSKTIGEHEPIVILDESPLLSPAKYLQVLKILEGTGTYDETFLFELGNAINRNHFMNNVKYNPDYYKIDISLEQAIAEGRLDARSVEEKRNLPFFEQFYLNKFPAEDEIDEKGYRQILTIDHVEKAQGDTVDLTDEPMALGVDIGGGGDKNVFVIRQGNHAWIESSNRSNDTMTNCNEVVAIIEKYTVELDGRLVRLIDPQHVYIDDIGIGRGVSDRLNEMKDSDNRNYYVQGISVGEKAEDPSKFKNIKAENYWLARNWIMAGGKLQIAKEWSQLTWIRYKISTDKVLQIEPKEDLKKRTNKSPDYAEAFMLTFSTGAPEPGIRLL